MPLVFAFLVGLIATVALVPVVTRVAQAFELFAEPSADRWHARAVPNVGGVAMAIPLLAVVALWGGLRELGPLAVATTMMFGLGLVDDLRPLRPATKLVLQMVIAAVLLWLLPPVTITGTPLFDQLLGFAWIVGITNAVNLLDHIDGLAAGVATIAGGFFLAVLLMGAAPGPLPAAMAAFVGVTAGFLVFNVHPASVFMGDGGSHLLGTFLAGATLMAAADQGPGLVPVAAIPVLLLLVPIFDTAFVTVSRGLAGRSAFLGGRDHTSHLLVALGIGERRAVLVLYALAAAGGLVALGLLRLAPGIGWGLVGAYLAVLVALGTYLGHIEASRGRDVPPPLPTEITTRYRHHEVALDLVLLSAAYYLAYLARFSEPQFSALLPVFVSMFPLVIGLQLAALWLTGKYRAVWGQLGPGEIWDLLRGTLLGVAASVIAVLYLNRFEGVSRLVFVFDALLASTFIVGARVGLSGIDQYVRLRRSRGDSAIVYGAGRGGALAVRELLQNDSLHLTPIGFIDDDAAKQRLKVDGLPVFGTLDDLPGILDGRPGRVAAVVVSMTALDPERFSRLCSVCAARGLAVHRMRFALDPVEHVGRDAQIVPFHQAHSRRDR